MTWDTRQTTPCPTLRSPLPARPALTYAGNLILHTGLLGDLAVPYGAARAAELQALAARAAIYATRARGDGTRRVYRSAWHGYEAWCRSLDREPLGGRPELIAMYATHRALARLRAARIARPAARHGGRGAAPAGAAPACPARPPPPCRPCCGCC